MIEFRYRPEIDGLRAVAVALVLLFHAGFGFTGGFVGVDVFFVISGFLITGLILKEQRTGGFRILGFWSRRIRRIIPVSAFVVAITLMAGTVLLLPSDLEILARSTVAQQLMVANFYFWKNTGYFDGPAELKPLLHMWSLAVEEQFYVVYPFLLDFVRRGSTSVLAVMLIVLALISFAISEWGVRMEPRATFFLLPTRAWELLAGGIVCLAPPPKLKSWQENLLSWFGIGLIFAAGWFFDSTTRFPGSAALVPCVGTALVIYSNSRKLTAVGRLLAKRPVVLVGLLSYSLYLWHWPILAFLRYWLQTPPVAVRAGALAVSFGLAYLSWRFVETPFRRTSKDARWRLPVTGAMFAAVLTVSTIVTLVGGRPFSLLGEVFPIANADFPKEFAEGTTARVERGELPVVGDTSSPIDRIDFVIWGDSHAQTIGRFCDERASRHGLRGVIAHRSSTVPVLDVWRRTTGMKAVDWNNALYTFIETRGVKHVVMAARWAENVEDQDALVTDSSSNGFSREEAKEVLRRGLSRTIQRLCDLGVKVWILRQVPRQIDNPRIKLCRSALWGEELPVGVSMKVHLSRQANTRAAFASLRPDSVVLLDPAPFCFDKWGNSKIGDPDGSYYWDDDHLSVYGVEKLLGDLLDPVFVQIADDLVRASD